MSAHPAQLSVARSVAGSFPIPADGKLYNISVNMRDQNGVQPPGEGMFLFNGGKVIDLTGDMPNVAMVPGAAYLCLLLPIVRNGNNLIIGTKDGEGEQTAATVSLDFSVFALSPSYNIPQRWDLQTPNNVLPESLYCDLGANAGSAQAVQLTIENIQESLTIHVFDRLGNLRYVFDKENQTTAYIPGRQSGPNIFDLGTGVIVMAFLKFTPGAPKYTFEIGDPRKDGQVVIDEVP